MMRGELLDEFISVLASVERKERLQHLLEEQVNSKHEDEVHKKGNKRK
jgi:hypothetical protein